MNIVVAGGGRVGFHVARLLSSENHDVTVIECDPNRLEFIDSALDARCVLGMSTSVMLLKQAGVDKTDLFVSTTGKDEENLISAATAKGLGAKQVLARADNLTYVESNILYESILGIDYILSPDALTAMEIAKYVEHPGMVGGEELGRGSVIMRQVRVDQLPNGTRQSVRDLELPPNVLLGIVNRNGKTTIPKGDTIIEINDLVTFVGTPDGVSEAQRIYHGTEPKVESVVIMGGSTI